LQIEYRLAVIAAGLLALSGCGRAEEPILDQFFGASRLRDTTALQQIATVTFEPLQQGIVRSFKITAVAAERPQGSQIAKDVNVDATVALPDGRTVQKALVVTLQRKSGDAAARWIVNGVRDAAASRPAPPS
jgi:hypothetical protein